MLTRLTERVIARRAGLGPATTRYRVMRAIEVPMRDGVTLLADHYASVTSAPAGTLLLRGPYKRDAVPTRLMMGLYAARGYHVVLQSTRQFRIGRGLRAGLWRGGRRGRHGRLAAASNLVYRDIRDRG